MIVFFQKVLIVLALLCIFAFGGLVLASSRARSRGRWSRYVWFGGTVATLFGGSISLLLYTSSPHPSVWPMLLLLTVLSGITGTAIVLHSAWSAKWWEERARRFRNSDGKRIMED